MKKKNLKRRRENILIVDDDKDLLDKFREILELEGYSVETALNGGDALKKLDKKAYNLALIDIRLPDMEGTELLSEIKDTLPKMVKIIITGYPSLENAVAALNKGADGYIIKPILNIDELIKTIKEHLEKQALDKRYTREKVEEYIQTRAKQLEQEIAED